MPSHRPSVGPAARRCVLLLAGALLTGSLTATAATAQAAPAPSPGGGSAGDSLFPTTGNTGYDVKRYDIGLSFLATSGRIRALTVVTARATHPLSSYSLDLEGLTVTGVSVDGHRASYRRAGTKLRVTPRHAVSGTFTTRVRYRGRPVTHTDPDGSADGWVPTKDGATVLAEPVGAMTWFPDNNTPRDKALYRVRVTVPKGLAVAGNGNLAGRSTRAGRTTWTWSQPQKMSTYLAMISIGRYRVSRTTMTTTTGRRLPVWSFVDPTLGRQTAALALVPKAVRFLEKRFGPYPFASTGVVIDDVNVGYALETQNRPVLDTQVGRSPDDLTVVHELAHQWYGDSVAARAWEDIWLDEGFASYAEDLWTAAHGGPSTAAAFRRRYAENGPGSALWSPAPARFSDPADLFGDPVYVRGGMTLEALRERVGVTAFSTILRRWASEHRHGLGTTPAFTALAERVSGQDLGRLFDEWLYETGRPSLS